MIDATNKARLLRRCNSHARTHAELTTADYVSSVISRHVIGWLAELVRDGLIYHHEGRYKTSPDGRAELARLDQEPTVATSRNFRAQGVYTGPARGYQRPGSDHSAIPSRGAGC